MSKSTLHDNLPTVWEAKRHTLAKHSILKAYLNAWMPILVRASSVAGNNVLFVDGFAGPGRYERGEPGSPIIALQTAMQHSAEFKKPVRFVFIEKDPERFAHLQINLNAAVSQVQGALKVLVDPPVCGDCNEVLSNILVQHEKQGRKFGPALVFLDQFGYSAVPMDLITKVLKYPACEIFSYLEYNHLIRFLTDETKWAGIDRAFGGTEWREAIGLPPEQKSQLILRLYRKALKERARATYVSHFSMYDDNGQLSHWLFFATNNLRGLEEMKKAMWTVDKSGDCRFSDRDNPGQETLFLSQQYTSEWLAAELSKRLLGRTMTIDEIKEYVLVETPCHTFKESLKILMKRRALLNGDGRPLAVSGFSDGSLQVRFVEEPQAEKQQLLF